jgi:hypothetical protein
MARAVVSGEPVAPASPGPVGIVVERPEDVLLRSLEKYYDDNPAAFDTLQAVLGGRANMSLRVLDFLVTNYAKKRNVVYLVRVGKAGHEAFNIYPQYESQLKAYNKIFFDPFARKHKVLFRGLDSTCGQLNFFKWAITNGVLDYAREHKAAIEADMLQSTKHRGGPAKPTKRKKLATAVTRTCTITHIDLKIKLC